jgi:hypothetical protein
MGGGVQALPVLEPLRLPEEQDRMRLWRVLAFRYSAEHRQRLGP